MTITFAVYYSVYGDIYLVSHENSYWKADFKVETPQYLFREL